MANQGLVRMLLELTQVGGGATRSEFEAVTSGDEAIQALVVEVGTSDVTVNLGEFTQIDALLLRNRSGNSASIVQARYANGDSSFKFHPSQLSFDWSSSPSPRGRILANTAGREFSFADNGFRAGALVTVTDANTSANEIVDVPCVRVDDDVLYFDSTLGFFTPETDPGTPTVAFSDRTSVPLGAGAVHAGNAVSPTADLVLRSASGTAIIDVWALGT